MKNYSLYIFLFLLFISQANLNSAIAQDVSNKHKVASEETQSIDKLNAKQKEIEKKTREKQIKELKIKMQKKEIEYRKRTMYFYASLIIAFLVILVLVIRKNRKRRNL